MSKLKAPVYKERGVLVDKELYDMLLLAINDVRLHMSADVPISRGGQQYGFGVDKAKRSIAVDNAISILKQIKAKCGW